MKTQENLNYVMITLIIIMPLVFPLTLFLMPSYFYAILKGFGLLLGICIGITMVIQKKIIVQIILGMLIRYFKFYRIEKYIKKYISLKPKSDNVFSLLRIFDLVGYDYSSYFFIKDYIINEADFSLTRICKLKKVFNLQIDKSIISKVIKSNGLSFVDVTSCLQKDIEKEQIIQYFMRDYILFSIERVSILLNEYVKEIALRESIIDTLIFKNLGLGDYRHLFENCQYARTNEKLIKDFAYRFEIDKIFLQMAERKAINRTSDEPNEVKNNDILKTLILLGTGYAIGSLFTDDND